MLDERARDRLRERARRAPGRRRPRRPARACRRQPHASGASRAVPAPDAEAADGRAARRALRSRRARWQVVRSGRIGPAQLIRPSATARQASQSGPALVPGDVRLVDRRRAPVSGSSSVTRCSTSLEGAAAVPEERIALDPRARLDRGGGGLRRSRRHRSGTGDGRQTARVIPCARSATPRPSLRVSPLQLEGRLRYPGRFADVRPRFCSACSLVFLRSPSFRAR